MYLLFDIGGTKTRIAVASGFEKIEQKVSFETPHIFEDACVRITEEVDRLTQGATITAAAGGVRGMLSGDHSKIIHESVLIDWVGKPLHARLRGIVNAPVYIENDAAVAGLGEARYGAGTGYKIVAYHTVSTGVGGARIVDRQIDSSHGGFEPGKQIIDVDHTIYPKFSERGTLEELISGEALEKRMGKKPYDIAQSDHVWTELALYLAHGLKNTTVYWSPDVIVLGGSMIVGDPRILRADITAYTQMLLGDIECPPILDASLEDQAGLYGGLALLEEVL
ncbi:ROK family protein [Patescibacteria group bacterium]|nr:ROK family protein [Patescibacteria group bacterium]